MLKLTLIIVLVSSLNSCNDSPTRSRTLNAPGTIIISPASNQNSNGGFNVSNPTSGSPSNSPGQINQLGPGFESCKLEQKIAAPGIGELSICQSQTSESQVAIRFYSTDTSIGTCFIPTQRNTSGAVVYVGVAQCSYHQSGETKIADLIKNRPGYQNARINGVMIMKHTILQSYFQCADAFDLSYQDCLSMGQNSQFCQSKAMNDKNIICSQFVSRGGFIDHSF